MPQIVRYKPMSPEPQPKGLFVADLNTFDVPNTICAAIANVPLNCVAVTLKPYGGAKMIQLAEHAARRKGIRIIWRSIGRRKR